MMRSKRLALVVSILVVAGVGFVLLDPAARLQGWIGGEPFYQGRSATAWRKDLNQEEATATAAKEALIAGKAEAVPICIWLLEHASQPVVRSRAVDAIRKIGPDAIAAGPSLLHALDDTDPLVRGVALQAVEEFAPALPPDAVPRLIGHFPSIEAIRAVAKFGVAGKEAIPALVKLMGHENTNVRFQAIRAIGKIGAPSRSLTPEILHLLETDPTEKIREIAAEVLGMFGPDGAAEHPRVVPALTLALKDPAWIVRRDAARSLGNLGEASKPALEDLKLLAGDSDARVREAVLKAIRQIEGGPSKK